MSIHCLDDFLHLLKYPRFVSNLSLTQSLTEALLSCRNVWGPGTTLSRSLLGWLLRLSVTVRSFSTPRSLITDLLVLHWSPRHYLCCSVHSDGYSESLQPYWATVWEWMVRTRADTQTDTLASATRACVVGCPKAPLPVDVVPCSGTPGPMVSPQWPMATSGWPKEGWEGGEVLLAYSNGLLNYNPGWLKSRLGQ